MPIQILIKTPNNKFRKHVFGSSRFHTHAKTGKYKYKRRTFSTTLRDRTGSDIESVYRKGDRS
jgi:hypothetical protein